ncbi:MAG: hypothetical protein IJ679_06030 [Lachnospiraceae bacterium]|nr:hypothetical protein [Lachnospiraceae bacterium]
MKFDIGSQQLKCDSCSSLFLVGQVPETRAAKGEGAVEAMIFSCPQCGGEVWSTSETAAGFCSFCGASVQLAGRMVEERMPEQIIPFQITKKECSERFRDHVRQFLFSPSDLSHENAKMEFRGIYMPYWDYTVHQEAQIDRTYHHTYRDGDYMVYDHYDFKWDLNHNVDAIEHDASLSFDDELGLSIAPFDTAKSKPFDSGYMEGFYGDVADTTWEDYADFALDEAVDYSEKAISQKTKGVRADEGPRGNEEFHGRITKRNLSLFPVWFLSYRSGSRIAYSVVNGQTGKVHVDLPVSLAKFFALTAAVTAALFFLLVHIFSPTPKFGVFDAMVMSVSSSIIFTVLTKKILIRDGLMEEKKKDESGGISEKEKMDKSLRNGMLGGCLSSLIIIPAIGAWVLFEVPLAVVLSVLALPLTLWALVHYLRRFKLLAKAKGRPVFPSPLFATLGIVAGIWVLLENPVSDLWYYGVTTAALFASSLSLVSVIQLRGMLSTRRLPQFDTHRGGNHRAR